MRNQFAKTITELAEKDEKVVLLSGDIGNRLFNQYKEIAPERFFNCGVAEQNMIGMASGLAMSGFKPVAYTITPFITTRCLEQIKIDVCYHKLPVVIVGTGSGLSYANLGPTHHSCEDIGILRTLPEMTVVCPADIVEVKLALQKALDYNRPVYIRIGKKNEPVIHKKEPDFSIGKAITVSEGDDVCILSTGNMLKVAVDTGSWLAQKNISSRVVSFHTVKPLDTELLTDVFSKYKIVVTLEEHNLIGGFGSAVAEWIIDKGLEKAELLRFGTPDIFIHEAGGQELARRQVGLTVENISNSIIKKLNG